MRKFLRLIMALVLTLGLCVPAQAAGAAVVSISSGTVSPGGDVTLTVSIQDNPGISVTVLYIYFDTSAFTANPNLDLRAAGDFSINGAIVPNSIAVARQNGRFEGTADQEGVLALWYNSSGLNTSSDGAVLRLTLHANTNALAGDYAIGVGYAHEDTCNEDGAYVTFNTVPGRVTVTGSGNQTPADKTQGGSQPSGEQTQPVGEQNQPSEGPDKPYEGPAEEPMGGTFDPAGGGATLFTDTAGNWAESYIRQAAVRGLIEGYNGHYRPGDSMTRAELVTILWRADGSPEGGGASFTDLTQGWYLDAVAWAERSGVVNGVGDGRFDPNGHVTREQLAAILHRMAGSPTGMEAMVSGMYDLQFIDSANVSDWAKPSLYWNVFNEIYCGEADLSVGQALAPKADATRAQIAVMIVRYLDQN